MKNRSLLFMITFGITLFLTACGTNAVYVPSLAATPTPGAVMDTPDDEALVMAFAECLRKEGLPVTDPVVDADGNVQLPELLEGETVAREEWGEAYEACGYHIEGLSFGREEKRKVEQLETYLAIATCLNEKGYEVEEPTTETLEMWMKDFRVEFDWDDPEATADYEGCASQE
jgi:hypothetical protein